MNKKAHSQTPKLAYQSKLISKITLRTIYGTP